MPEPASSVLALRNVEYRSTSPLYADLTGITTELHEGELFLVRVMNSAERYPLADLAEGLVAPTRGTVLFEGRDWRKMSPFEQTAARGRIGRVFEDQAWVSNLNVLENVTLAQRHHTRRPNAEIEAEAEQLARRVGLDGVPSDRPHLFRRDVLQRAQWVRAFLGNPLLVLLEQPENDVPPKHLPVLLDLVSEARNRGAAVVWITRAPEVWKMKALMPTRKYTIEAGHWAETVEDR